jgi:transcriptional regulator with XRE-family HTH domain
MAADKEPSTLYQILGANLRTIRKDRGWSQDELARRARAHGLKWSRSSVAAFESAKQSMNVQDLVLLLITLQTSVGELLTGDGGALVSKSVILDLKDLRTILTTDGPAGGLEQPTDPLRLDHDVERQLDRSRSEADEVWLQWISDARREAEQKAARRVGVPVDAFVDMAVDRWGQSLTEERDERAEAAARHIDSSRGLQASRGHITRQLLEELEPQIQDYLKRAEGD